MTNPDRIERVVEISAPIEVVCRAVTESTHVVHWLCDKADFEARPGSTGTMSWHGAGDFEFRVQSVSPPDRFLFRWVYPLDAEPNDTNSLLV